MSCTTYLRRSYTTDLSTPYDVVRFLWLIIVSLIGVTLSDAVVAKVMVPISVDDITIVVPVERQWSKTTGSIDPGPMCAAASTSRPRWGNFACSFLTKSLWERAGRPKLDSDGNPFYQTWPGWVPVFNSNANSRNYGLLEYFEYSLNGGASAIRYAPWSDRAQNGAKTYIVMPWDTGTTLKRYNLIVFDDSRYGLDSTPGPQYPYEDYKDPTLTYESGSMGALSQLIAFHQERYQSDPNALYHLLVSGPPNRVASGVVDWFYPDYKQDGKVFLMKPNGAQVELPNLESAAEYAATYGIRFANGSLNSLDEARASALQLATNLNRPVVYMYHAQNAWYFNNIAYDAFPQRWIDWTKAAASVAAIRGTSITDVCHSNSCFKVAMADKSFSNINVFAVNPAHAFWSQPFWVDYLQNGSGRVYLATGSLDPVTLFTGGSGLSGLGNGDPEVGDPASPWGSIGSSDVHRIIYNSARVTGGVYNCSHPLANMLYTCGAVDWLRAITPANFAPF